MSDSDDLGLSSDEEFLQTGEVAPIDTYKKQLKERKAQAKINENFDDHPSAVTLKKLDTNIRKNSAFVKAKLETLRENQRQALTNEFYKLNLVRYKAEAVTTLTTTKYRV